MFKHSQNDRSIMVQQMHRTSGCLAMFGADAGSKALALPNAASWGLLGVRQGPRGVPKIASVSHKSVRKILVSEFYKWGNWDSGRLCSFLKGNWTGKQRSWDNDLVSKPRDTESYLEGLWAWQGSSHGSRSVEPAPNGHVEVKNFQINRQRRKQSHSVTTKENSPNHHLIFWLPNNNILTYCIYITISY